MNRIFVIGHSEGATLAPEIAERAAPVAGVVMPAPSGVRLLDILIRQRRHEGAPSKLIAQTEKVSREIMQWWSRLAGGRSGHSSAALRTTGHP